MSAILQDSSGKGHTGLGMTMPNAVTFWGGTSVMLTRFAMGSVKMLAAKLFSLTQLVNDESSR